MLERVQACSGPTPAEMYSLQGENRKRTEEVRELQKVQHPHRLLITRTLNPSCSR